jgi:DNA invertase Pin-like site-specific DNA recombinase
METCVILLRKSNTNAEADDFDIQEDVCRKYADKMDYKILKVLREAHSGKSSPMTRNIMKEAVDDIKHHRAKVLIVRDLDRLARTTNQIYYYLFQVEEMYHGRVELAQGTIDRTSPFAKQQMHLAAMFAEMERDNIETRTKAGKRKRAERGQLMAAAWPAYGYRWADDEIGQRTRYEIDPASSVVVKQMFDWAAQGQSLKEIARKLNQQHLPTPSTYAASLRDTGRQQSQIWHWESVRSILRQPGYAGQALAFRHNYEWQYDDKQDVDRLTRKASENALELPTSAWPAIITPEQFHMVQQRLKLNKAGRRPADRQAVLFQGHVYCGCCGKRMVGQKTGQYYSYRCSSRRTVVADASLACPGGHFTIQCHKADAEGWDGVKMLMTSRERFEELLREKVQTQPEDDMSVHAAVAVGALRQKQDELDNLARRVGMASDAVAKVLIEQMEVVSKEVKGLEKQANDAQRLVDDRKAADAWVNERLERIYGWLEYGAHVSDGYGTGELLDEALDKLPFDLKRVAIEASGIRVYVFPAGWEDWTERRRTLILYNIELPVAQTSSHRPTTTSQRGRSSTAPAAMAQTTGAALPSNPPTA